MGNIKKDTIGEKLISLYYVLSAIDVINFYTSHLM